MAGATLIAVPVIAFFLFVQKRLSAGLVAGGGEGMTMRGNWSVGLDIGGTKVLGVLLDGDGAVRGTVRVPTRLGIDGVVGTAADVVARLCGAAGLAPADLAGGRRVCRGW